jgi:4-amino-4-deoxy-L-arabinose transferase-like glycosyltransferase
MKQVVFLHAAVFALALATRLGLAVLFVGLSAPPKGDANPDQLDYEVLAFHVSSGDGFALEPGEPSSCRPPGTAFFLIPVYVLFGRSYLAARIWFCLLSAACCPITGWIAHRLVGQRTGLLAAAWLAFYPGHAYYSVHFLSETPTTLLTAIAVALQIGGALRPAGPVDLCTGLTWGLGILVRPNLAIAAALTVLIILVAGPGGRRFRIQKALVIGGTAALVVGPWVVRNTVVMEKPGICTIVGGYTFWGSHNPQVAEDPKRLGSWVAVSTLVDAEHPLIGSEVAREAQAWEYGFSFVRAHPDRILAMKYHALLRVIWAYQEAENWLVNLGFRLGWIASLPFVMLGLVMLARRAPLATLQLVTPLAVVLVTALVFYGCSRFRDGAAPVLAVFAAAGVDAVSEWVFKRSDPINPDITQS